MLPMLIGLLSVVLNQQRNATALWMEGALAGHNLRLCR